MTDAETNGPAKAPEPGVEIVPALRAGPIARTDGSLRLILDANREFTFGFLLGYLSLALHATLQYTRFAGLFVGPWEVPTVGTDDPTVRVWTRSVTRRSSYAPDALLGEVSAVLSDGLTEPSSTFAALADPGADLDPPRHVPVRTRRPRVDFVIRPVPGSAFELHSFAREVGERFRRNLD